MAQSDPGIANLMKETAILQLIQSHLEDERESVKNVATWTMRIFSES